MSGVRGELPERWAGLRLDPRGACMEWLAALGRPAVREELERLSDMAREVGELAAHGVAMLSAVPGAHSLEAMVVCEERADGAPFGLAERERLGVLCAAAAPARAVARRFRAQQDRALDLLSAPASSDPRRRAAAREADERLLSLVDRLGMSPADRALLGRVLDLGPWAWSEAGREALGELAGDGLSCELAQLRDLVLRAHHCASGEPGAVEDALPMLAATGLRYQALRLAGRSAFESWRTAVMWVGAHTHPCLRGAFPEATTAPDPKGAAGRGRVISWLPRASTR